MLTRLLSLVGLRSGERIIEGAPRASGWSALRARFVRIHPRCAACGTLDKIEVHHVRPYHLYPELELSWDNLLPLCERDHLLLGHLGHWRAWNPAVREDASWLLARIATRPLVRA